MSFLNPDKRQHRHLTVDEKLALHRALYEGQVVEWWKDVLSREDGGVWCPHRTPDHGFQFSSIYRVRPPEPKPIRGFYWSQLRPVIKCIAMDADGEVYGFTSDQVETFGKVWQYTAAIRSENRPTYRLDLVLNLNTEGVLWEQSLLRRPDPENEE